LTFTEYAAERGHLLRVVPISRIEDLRREQAKLTETNQLNDFQKKLMSGRSLALPELPFVPKSIIIAVTEHYSYANVTFNHKGRQYNLYSAFVDMYDTSTIDAFGAEALPKFNASAVPAHGLFPEKLLGVMCGLAEYGRNNITYINTETHALGSYFGYSTYYSDLPPESDFWRGGGAVAKQCETCGACASLCKTGAISREQFLIDTDKCYSRMTTAPGDFVDVPSAAHHSIIRCMKCQYRCPMNREASQRKYRDVEFSEAETDFILRGESYENAPESLRERAVKFGLDLFSEYAARNIKKCFELIDSGETLTLY